MRAENSTSSFEQLIVAAIKLMVFKKFSHFAKFLLDFFHGKMRNFRIFAKFCFIYFREKMRNFVKKFAFFRETFRSVETLNQTSP